MNGTDFVLAIAIWLAGLGGLSLALFGLVVSAWSGSSLVDPPILPAGLALWVIGGLLMWVGKQRSKNAAHDG